MSLISSPRKGIVLLFLLLVTSAVFGNTFVNQWSYDDPPVVLKNPDAHSLSGFLENKRLGRPMRELTYIPDHILFGDKPAGYRVQQLAWHGVNGFLLVLLFHAFGVELPVALLGALFFLVHPLQTESVASIANRKELLALFFSLGSLLCYVKSFTSVGARRLLLRVGALIAYGGALLSNETTVTLPLVAVLWELLLVEREKRVLLRKPLLALAVSIVAGAVFIYFFRWIFSADQLLTVYSKNSFGASQSYIPLFMGAMKAFGFYLGKIILPAGLAPEYTFQLSESLWQPQALLSLTLLAGAAACAASVRRSLPLVSLGIGWFIVFWLPISDLVPVGYLAADRYMYLCLPGIGLVLAGLLQRWPKRLFVAGTCLVLVVFAGLTVVQNGYWRNEHTLWRHAVTVNPDSTWVQETVALSYLLTGDYGRAVGHAEEALRLNRFNTRAYVTLAKAQERLGNLAEAVRNYEMFASFGAMEYPEEAAQIRLYLPALRERFAAQKGLQ
ncbi:hypothetical protein KI811_13265 [Geobacter hydrogenophilus]|uniref:Membrane protein n=1 Tax=Geobacter hydrogenophilus TaxID=40983 RepID=A0A9W6FYZ9_9BACT|nr:hypothetical protein [Geobacter hydrogenophilus]MBT0894779.1 hypothetical protein [Geobacter hydrogenophilus]GLI37383.1 membrane protein [Geobacter hydrogenophilus]